MKLKKFLVEFSTGLFEIVFASNTIEAEILAQAEQIKKGNDYKVTNILNCNSLMKE